jgi:peptide subunit release factor 1 (eRF1)
MTGKEQSQQESLIQRKSILQELLEKTSWEDIYEEHYGKEEIEKELPKGLELQKHFVTSKWFKHINK